MSDYRCKVRIIHEKEITVHAKNKKEAEEEAKEKVAKIAAEKIKKGEKKVGQFIHEVDDDFEIASDIDVGHKMGDER